MYSNLVVDIRPGSGLGIFEIGMSHCVQCLPRPERDVGS